MIVQLQRCGVRKHLVSKIVNMLPFTVLNVYIQCIYTVHFLYFKCNYSYDNTSNATLHGTEIMIIIWRPFYESSLTIQLSTSYKYCLNSSVYGFKHLLIKPVNFITLKTNEIEYVAIDTLSFRISGLESKV